MKSRLPALLIGAAALLAPAVVSAHFILLAPAATLEQNRLGDPQKLGPCGGTSANAGTPTNAVTEVRGGDMLPIRAQETVFHPGHYRVALAVNSISELPADPETVTRETERGPYSVSAKIGPNDAPPVIADGLFVHTERPPQGQQLPVWETQVKIPNINCDHCTLQVIQWMAEHGLNADGDFTHHHCATLKITANSALPLDRRWPGQG
jgi:hypothetical protein